MGTPLEWLPESVTMRLLLAIAGLLLAATLGGGCARLAAAEEHALAAARSFMARLRLWWLMTAVFALALFSGGSGSIVVFFGVSFLLLREFVTITPTRPGDHHTLLWVFFVILPLQYLLVWLHWYGLFSILIPVYAFLLIPISTAVLGDPCRFLERVAKLQWALMVCVYCVSHAPALLRVELVGGREAGPRLLLFLCTVVQAADATHEVVDLWRGHRGVVPGVSPRRTWAGFLASLIVAALVGLGLSWATPMAPVAAAGMGMVCGVLAAAGNLCLAAIYRDRGREGIVVVRTRANLLDRTISLCFAAPVFLHLVRYYLGASDLMTF